MNDTSGNKALRPDDGIWGVRWRARLSTAWAALRGSIPRSETAGSDARGLDNKRTDRIMRRLFMTGMAALLVIAAFGLSIDSSEEAVSSMNFIGWAFAAAFAAFIFGIALGTLFGLPNRRIIAFRSSIVAGGVAATPKPAPPPVPAPVTDKDKEAVAGGAPAPPAAAAPSEDVKPNGGDHDGVPYEDSTSLEQIADWLTKIIVGLTLTQYATWEARFTVFAGNLTATLFNRRQELNECLNAPALSKMSGTLKTIATERCYDQSGGAVPGGLILVGFSLLGFILAYLWMRRYFIAEMVLARTLAAQQLRADADLEKTKAEVAAERIRATQAVENAKADAAAQIEAARALAASQIEQAKAEREKLAAQLRAFQESGGVVENPEPRALADAETLDNIAKNAIDFAPAGSAARKTLAAIQEKIRKGNAYPNDPWRSMVSAESRSANYALTSRVAALPADPNNFQVDITVEALTPETVQAVAGKQSVIFLLHPTFGDRPPTVAFGPDGKAVLQIFSYGAFAVGAIMEDGTALELNLASDETAPPAFRQR